MRHLHDDVLRCSEAIHKKKPYPYRIGETVTVGWFHSTGATYVGYGCASGIGMDSGAIRVAPIDTDDGYFLSRTLNEEEVYTVHRALSEMYGPDYQEAQYTVEGAFDMESYDV